MSKLGEAYFFHQSPIYPTKTVIMETLELHACDSPLCPSVKITGKHVASIALAIIVFGILVYLAVKYKAI